MNDSIPTSQEIIETINKNCSELLTSGVDIRNFDALPSNIKDELNLIEKDVEFLGITNAINDESSPYHSILCHGVIPILYKYTKLEYALDDIKENHLYCSAPAHLNDPFECKLPIGEIPDNNVYQNLIELLSKLVSGLIFDRYTRTRIASFTETMTIPMWAYYGGNGEGVAIELDSNKLLKNNVGSIVGKVNYSDDRQSILSIRSWIDVASVLLGFYAFDKHSSWSHENEWRLVILSKDTIDITDCIKGVILGYNVDVKDEIACELISECNKLGIPVKQAVIEDFNTKIIPI